MEHTIIHQGGFTVTLESDGSLSARSAGRLPTLDDIARDRARTRYIDTTPENCEENYNERLVR